MWIQEEYLIAEKRPGGMHNLHRAQPSHQHPQLPCFHPPYVLLQVAGVLRTWRDLLPIAKEAERLQKLDQRREKEAILRRNGGPTGPAAASGSSHAGNCTSAGPAASEGTAGAGAEAGPSSRGGDAQMMGEEGDEDEVECVAEKSLDDVLAVRVFIGSLVPSSTLFSKVCLLARYSDWDKRLELAAQKWRLVVLPVLVGNHRSKV